MSDVFTEVSVLILTYNSKLDEIMSTLDSVLCQVKSNFEIIIADDGSADNHFSDIEEYFKKNKFVNYKLIGNEKNQGTVLNTLSGVLASTGKYVKDISPGDCLYKQDTLRKWYDYMEAEKLAWSFCDVIYYKMKGNTRYAISVNAHPNDIGVYMNGSSEDKRWNYFAIGDISVGAAMMTDRELLLKYIQEIAGKVIYAEDNVWRMMMYDGILGGYYQYYGVLYEYGSGISTSGNSKWFERIMNDWKKTNEILRLRDTMDSFQKQMIETQEIMTNGTRFQKLFVKGNIKNSIKKIRKRKTIGYFPE